jgi:hypothetical protein
MFVPSGFDSLELINSLSKLRAEGDDDKEDKNSNDS